MYQQFQEWMNLGLGEFSVDLSELQMEQFFQYYEMLIEWNRVMNLTSITEMRQVIFKHFIDSLSLVKAVPELNNDASFKIIDLGTGAGFPGIPLKLAFPENKILLLDSLGKRIKFLDEVIISLKLSNIMTVHCRAEDLGHDKNHREKYDFCVSRAVANLSTLSEYCLPFVRPGGCFISYKSGTIEDELDQAKHAINILGGQTEQIITFQLPDSGDGRSLVVIRKKNFCSDKYPRKAGMPGKEPL